MTSQAFAKLRGSLRLALGLDAGGAPIALDLRAMPHLLIGGTVGSGKSICIHAIIDSLLLRSDPDAVRFLMIDTKMVELGLYEGIPHLIEPMIAEASQAASALQAVRSEATKRLEQFSTLAARDIGEYNRRCVSAGAPRLPFIVAVVDDVAELMAGSPRVVADALEGLAADGRPAGIHLIVSTSRPSDNVLARSIKGNFPGRIAFRTASVQDSRILLDRSGAEKLAGSGDMLLLTPSASDVVRVQGVLVSDGEIRRLADYWRMAGKATSPDAGGDMSRAQ